MGKFIRYDEVTILYVSILYCLSDQYAFTVTFESDCNLENKLLKVLVSYTDSQLFYLILRLEEKHGFDSNQQSCYIHGYG